jgi:pyruvate dehydrogenase E2 component (dihydrolipoamide acetyltransferase)
MSKLRAFTMPKWGIEMTEGVIAEWLVEEGKPFAKGDLIALIETDKITNELEAEYDGKFARLVAAEGDTCTVGELIGVLSGPDEDPASADVDSFIENFKPADTRTASKGGRAGQKKAAPAAQPEPAPAPAPEPAQKIAEDANISPMARQLAEERGVDIAAIGGSGRNGRITYQDVLQASLPPVAVGGEPVTIEVTGDRAGDHFASPLAKRLAVLHDVDLSGIEGTGPRGRICKADVLAKVEAVPTAVAQMGAGVVDVVSMSPMRKAIARSLSHSKATIPHFYLRQKVRIDALLALRSQAKAATGEAPSVNDYFIRACALALKAHPDVNIQVHGDEIHRYPDADISVAVATEKGLLTPIVRGADGLSVAAISRTVKALAEKARDGKLQAGEIQGGSFSISNLGMFGIDQFDAIINPPQGAILAIGAGSRQPVEADHALAFATLVELSLSCDHRAIDGALGARFMQTLKSLIESPAGLTA